MAKRCWERDGGKTLGGHEGFPLLFHQCISKFEPKTKVNK
jgi:hypothetical protein